MVAIDLWGACSERTVLMTCSGGDGGVSGESIEGDSGGDELDGSILVAEVSDDRMVAARTTVAAVTVVEVVTATRWL